MKIMLIPGLVILLVVALFLFLPKANAYFAGAEFQTTGESD